MYIFINYMGRILRIFCWAKKALLFDALIKKPFLTQIIFDGGSISARSKSQYTIGYTI